MKLIVGLGNPGKKYEGTRHNAGFMVVDAFEQEVRGQRSEVRGKIGGWKLKKKLLAWVSGLYTLRPRSSTLILAKPTVFMNESGRVVKKLLKHFKVRPANLWVVHDDIDLPLGRIKIKVGGGTAGHHGVESVIEGVGSKEFVRIRLGIGHPGRSGKCEVPTRGVEDLRRSLDTLDSSRVVGPRPSVGMRGGFRNAKLALNRTCSGSGWEMREKVVEKFVLSKFSKEEKPVVEEMVERAAEAIKLGLEEGIERVMARKF